MKILFISNLYPSAVDPDRAPYNRQLMKAMSSHAEVRVIAPFAWFPGQCFIRHRETPPADEVIDNIRVTHPKVLYSPGLLIHKHWQMYQWSIRKHFVKMVEEYKPDHVIIGFAYPDGVAVAPLCRVMGLSYSIRVNGSDFNLRIRQEKFRDMVLKALNDAPLIFCPGSVLKRAMVAEGIDEKKIVVFENGVDENLFTYRSKEDAIRRLEVRSQKSESRFLEGVSGFRSHPSSFSAAMIILFVGNLVGVKGPDVMLEAFARIARSYQCAVNIDQSASQTVTNNQSPITNNRQQLRLLMLGDGPLRPKLEKRARMLGIADSVCFMGSRPHEEVALWVNVSDCLCLTSMNEGMPNVVIEALASGLPVVATNAGSVMELLENESGCRVVRAEESMTAKQLNNLTTEQFASKVASVLAEVLESNIDRKAIAERNQGRFSWNKAVDQILSAVARKA